MSAFDNFCDLTIFFKFCWIRSVLSSTSLVCNTDSSNYCSNSGSNSSAGSSVGVGVGVKITGF